jgi:hypothetical protein
MELKKTLTQFGLNKFLKEKLYFFFNLYFLFTKKNLLFFFNLNEFNNMVEVLELWYGKVIIFIFF